jgi:pilus assembly protein CpaE
MADRIKVLIVDDIPETRDHLSKLLGFEADVEVVGAAAGGVEAIEMAGTLHPDVVLMDINMPGMDGITATERLATEVPTAAVVMMSVQGEADYLRRSMLAGAREFLVKPFSADELTASIRQVWAREREKLSRMAPVAASTNGTSASSGGDGDGEAASVVAVFSPKGGVGRTTVAVNLAVAAATLGRRVALVDASFQFGDVGVLLNLNPKNKSIGDLATELQTGEAESLDTFMITHSSGVRVLLAPPSPEQAELIGPLAVKRVLQRLRGDHDLVVVDCPSSFNEPTLAVLDESDMILTLLTLEITSVKNMRLFLEVAEQLGYSQDKIRLVLNRADSTLGIRVADVEHSIGRKVDHTIVSDGRSVVYALNRGVPFFLSNREAQVSQDIQRLAQAITGPARKVAPDKTDKTSADKTAKTAATKKSLFAWR